MNGLFKAAFAVSFGLTMGKYVGGLASAALDGVVLGITELAAKNGSEVAKNAMNKAVYKTKETNQTEKVIGFHPE